jgi:alkanesulfonate monooxygenase SsuD/methylene tetrahydromethanopterin reductase-like flavin-dependent oxidoreductase (luciferase family)
MQRRWTEPSLSFQGRYEQVTGAGIRPLPVQRPIPIWTARPRMWRWLALAGSPMVGYHRSSPALT